jgi:tetratricopeptide (TPR) repeat protein
LVDGIPLAIELTAAWVGSKTLSEIRAGLGSRMDLLKRRGLGAASRHQGMRACLDYSFGLLSEDGRGIVPKLTVFAGGFFAEHVQAVCGVSNASQLLVSLHERGLLVRQEVCDRSRYSMLATVQEYAAEKLREPVAAELKRSHARYFLEVLSAADEQLGGSGYVTALKRIAIDFANFEAGIRESQQVGDHRAVVEYVGFLGKYLRIRGQFNPLLKLALAARAAAENLGPEVVARANRYLGIAYADLPTGDCGENLQHAIECHEATLRVWTERDFPQDWAMTQNNLGIAYADLPTGDRSENLQHSIECYQAALRISTERDFPQYWAMTQNNLGGAYGALPTGDRGHNLRRAIDCYEAALRVWTERDVPQNWAGAQNNLGVAYSKLPTGDRGENLRRAIDCYKAALRVRTERDFPPDWATTQNNLGGAYCALPTDDHGYNSRRAIDYSEAALRVWTERDFPQNWAAAQNNLGIAYAHLPAGDVGYNLQRAIDCYEAALRVWIERDFPQAWATTQHNL